MSHSGSAGKPPPVDGVLRVAFNSISTRGMKVCQVSPVDVVLGNGREEHGAQPRLDLARRDVVPPEGVAVAVVLLGKPSSGTEGSVKNW